MTKPGIGLQWRLQQANAEPGMIGQINAVTKFWMNDCDIPWTVYAETAIAPLGELALALLSFDMFDVMRGYFRPKNLRTGSHLRARRRRKKGKFGIPETGEMVARHIPGYDQMRNRTVSDGVKHLWKIDGVMQRGLFAWMIADVTSDFFYNWTTLLMHTEEGADCAPAALLREGPCDVSPGYGTWRWVRFINVRYARGGAYPVDAAIHLPPGRWHVAMHLKARNWSEDPKYYQCGITRGSHGYPDLCQSERVLLAPGEVRDFVCVWDGEYSGYITPVERPEPGPSMAYDGFVSVAMIA